MAEYEKPWLLVDGQIDRLIAHEIEVDDRAHAAEVLQAVGYYRLTGYLYPFRRSERRPARGQDRSPPSTTCGTRRPRKASSAPTTPSP